MFQAARDSLALASVASFVCMICFAAHLMG